MIDKKELLHILDKKEPTQSDIDKIAAWNPKVGQHILYSFYTPVWLCEVMYSLAKRYGFKPGGKVLEPSCGNGNFLSVLDRPENCTAFELDELNSRIAQKRAPKAKVFNQYFETAFLQEPRYTYKIRKGVTWLKDYPFDLVIGNPPYGKYSGLYAPYFKNLKMKQMEQFFMLQSMKLLKPGGLLVFITASSFMRNHKTYYYEKKKIGEYADFVDAYRMPKVFKDTSVPTDILIFRRK